MSNINWNELLKNCDYTDLKHKKDSLYDYIIGELNRISVSDDFTEKEYLFNCLKKNIEYYYKYSVECTKIILSYKE